MVSWMLIDKMISGKQGVFMECELDQSFSYHEVTGAIEKFLKMPNPY